MTDEPLNVYNNERRARAYATLEYPGTYYLAFRDIPALIERHVTGRKALDFGCGAGRSTRFLKDLGFLVTGVDISAPMLEQAREIDPAGDYRLLAEESGLAELPAGTFDLVLCAFPFDNVPTGDRKVAILAGLRRLLAPRGRIVNLVSSPEIYVNEWTSFSTKDFPENRLAKSGDTVRVIMLDVEDRRPVEDTLWSHEAWEDVYREAGLGIREVHRPLGRSSEPYRWVSETSVAPWVIYMLGAGTEE